MKKIILALSLLTSFSAFSTSNKPYGYAGCGFGSVVVGKDGPQILAATSKDISTQTFSISSGTSNCVDPVEKTTQIKNFIEANYESLITEMAKGSGNTIYTLSSLYGCDSVNFARVIQKNYSQFLPNEETASEMMKRFGAIIKGSELNQSCYNVI